ncbi:MAG: hypothetical protein PVH65_05560 [Chloroflexota bacterium]|jgi:hypothetical protein
MVTQTSTGRETQFNLGAWLTLFFAIIILVAGIAELTYRFTLPTDGWEVNDAPELGFTYTKNLLDSPSGLQPGDQVIALEGIPADWQTIDPSSTLRDSWRAGVTLDYTVLRDGQETHIPVTLVHWQVGKWLRAVLFDPVKVMGQLSGIVLLGLAFFVFLRRPGDSTAGAFLLIMTILAVANLGGILPLGFAAWIDPIEYFSQNTVNWILIGAVFPFALIKFVLVFPHPKPIYQRHPWLTYLVLAIGLLPTIFASGSPISWFWFVSSLFLAVGILIHNAFTMRDAVSRAQMRWGLGGFIIGFGTLALMFLAGTSGLVTNPIFPTVTFTLATTVMGIMLAIAITRYRLFDIDIIIRKTLVYAVLTGLLGLVYFGVIVVLQSIFEAVSGQQSPISIVISTLIIAALFGALQRRVQDFIDRRFYRRKYDAVKTLAAFGHFVRDETDLEALTAELLRVTEETMQPEQASIWLK